MNSNFKLLKSKHFHVFESAARHFCCRAAHRARKKHIEADTSGQQTCPEVISLLIMSLSGTAHATVCGECTDEATAVCVCIECDLPLCQVRPSPSLFL